MLSDSDKRARYDQYGHAGVDPNFGAGGAGGFNGAGFGFDDLGDIFSSFFGGGFGGGRQANPNAPRRGEDIQARVTISFEEAAKGCKRTIEVTRVDTCPDCHGSGAKRAPRQDLPRLRRQRLRQCAAEDCIRSYIHSEILPEVRRQRPCN